MVRRLRVIQAEPIGIDSTGTIWRRIGECNRCGDCCKGDPFLGELGEPKIHGYCPLYDIRDGLGFCTDRQNSYYLNGCVHYPSTPDQVADKPNCSYSFVKVSGVA